MSKVTKPIPSRPGDVLVLSTTQSFTIYAVGLVDAEGQQDFGRPADVTYISDLAEAMAEAKRQCAAGCRIFLVNVDTSQWKEVEG